MNLGQMETMVQRLVGDSDQSQFLLTDIDQYINWAMRDIGRKLDLFVKTTTFAAFDAGPLAGGIILPVDFGRVLTVYVNSVKQTPMPRGKLWNDTSISLGTGTPVYYAIHPYEATSKSRRMVFYPYQNLNGTASISLTYVARAADMSVAGTECPLPDDLHEIVVLMAVYKCKIQENDLQAAGFIQKDIDDRMAWSAYNVNQVEENEYSFINDDPFQILVQD